MDQVKYHIHEKPDNIPYNPLGLVNIPYNPLGLTSVCSAEMNLQIDLPLNSEHSCLSGHGKSKISETVLLDLVCYILKCFSVWDSPSMQIP
jgi:hypothetical protein